MGLCELAAAAAIQLYSCAVCHAVTSCKGTKMQTHRLHGGAPNSNAAHLQQVPAAVSRVLAADGQLRARQRGVVVAAVRLAGLHGGQNQIMRSCLRCSALNTGMPSLRMCQAAVHTVISAAGKE